MNNLFLILTLSLSVTSAIHIPFTDWWNGNDYVTFYSSSESKLNFDEPALVKIEAFHSSICQVRLDFIEFDLQQPNKDGICVEEWLRVDGHRDSNMPIICGQNAGQHVYLNFKETRTPIELSLKYSNFVSNWNIKATQIDCRNSAELAPKSCLQYFTETSGTVKSMNYPNQHLANQDYDICLSGTSTCTVEWKEVETESVIDISPHYPSPAGDDCEIEGLSAADYLTVPFGVYYPSGNELPATKVCGDRDAEPGMIFYGTGVVPALSVFFNGDEADENGRIDTTLGRHGFELDFRLTC